MDEQQGWAARPLLPAAARRPAAVIAVACAVVTLVLGVLIARTSHAGLLDKSVDAGIQQSLGAHRGALRLLADAGQPAEVAVLTAVIVLVCFAARRVNGAMLAVLSITVSVVLTELVLKPLFGRTLGGYLVYPSGHTGRAFTLAAVTVVLLLNLPGRRRCRPLTAAVAAVTMLAASAVAVAMIGLKYHYFTDTVGGAALAIAVVLGTSLVLDTDGIRRRLPRSDWLQIER